MSMSIFVGWSGGRSHELAKAIHAWLPKVIHMLDTFISSDDIDLNERWTLVLAEKLQSAKYGIICVTKENMFAPWLHFETGALSIPFDEKRACPVLFDLGISVDDLPDTIKQFQPIQADKRGIWKLIRMFNAALRSGGLSEQKLQESFDLHWPELEKAIKQITQREYLDDIAFPGRVSGYLGKAVRKTHPVFRQLLGDSLTSFESEAREWAHGTITANPRTYKATLVDIYKNAKRSIFSTSIDKYLEHWSGHFGKSILDAHQLARSQHQPSANDDKNRFVVQRVFVFDNARDVSLKTIDLLDEQRNAGVDVLIFYNDDPGHAFDGRLNRDFTIIDDGEVIGVTEDFGADMTRALWRFDDKGFALDLNAQKRKIIFESWEYTDQYRKKLIEQWTAK